MEPLCVAQLSETPEGDSPFFATIPAVSTGLGGGCLERRMPGKKGKLPLEEPFFTEVPGLAAGST